MYTRRINVGILMYTRRINVGKLMYTRRVARACSSLLASCRRTRAYFTCSLYVFYWYKSTNTARAARAGGGAEGEAPGELSFASAFVLLY